MAQSINVTIKDFDGQNPAVVDAAGGVTEIHSSAGLRLIPSTVLPEGDWVLEMQCFCLGRVGKVNASLGPDYLPISSQSLQPIEHSETFVLYQAKLESNNPSKGTTDIRLDLSMEPNASLQIKNPRLRRQRAGEFDAPNAASANAADSMAIRAYLSRAFNSSLTNVSIGATKIKIAGVVSGESEEIFLGDVPMETRVTDPEPYHQLVPISVDTDGRFSLELPRMFSTGERTLDRLTARWQLFRLVENENKYVAISHARYADEVACRSPELPAAKPASKKGLGGWSFNRNSDLKDELQTLGISAVTVNVAALHQYVSRRPISDATPFTWQGQTYYANESKLQRLDDTFREAEKNGVMVSAILLISNAAGTEDADAKLLAHPEAVRQGKYAMPNVTSTAGIEYYGAILNLMAQRWSRDDGVHGRVHQWIVHNEVDAGWVWTNAGRKTDIAFMDLYQRSMRLVDLIARQYDPNARAWVTLTHHWAEPGNKNFYGSKRMLELLAAFCQAEGDFPWALAYHPYPQSLFNPRTWEDDQATYEFQTAKITPKNLEVLDAYMKRREMRYRGAVRPVHLSENGFNSRDYSAQALEDQAAGMAFAWKKIEKLSSIESWQYHNWIDNRSEGGLRIGLRRFPDDSAEKLGKKPIWYLYQALGTPQGNRLIDQYLKTIGIQSWEGLIYTKPIQ